MAGQVLLTVKCSSNQMLLRFQEPILGQVTQVKLRFLDSRKHLSRETFYHQLTLIPYGKAVYYICLQMFDLQLMDGNLDGIEIFETALKVSLSEQSALQIIFLLQIVIRESVRNRGTMQIINVNRGNLTKCKNLSRFKDFFLSMYCFKGKSLKPN